MAPIRTFNDQAEASTSHSKQNQKSGKSKRRQSQHQPGKESSTPGISKIKSSLRQTRRLLAKDKLAADVRVETERRLKALQGELAQAEVVKQERKLATRYHKIKFFERQKVTRKINQTKKQLSSATDKAAIKKLNTTLDDLRIDLNYILHYPKLQKYVSLFPPETRQSQPAETTAKEEAAETVQTREEVRSWVRSCMDKGELPKEPELHPSSNSERGLKPKDWENSRQSKDQLKGVVEDNVIEPDEFFGDDDDDEEE